MKKFLFLLFVNLFLSIYSFGQQWSNYSSIQTNSTINGFSVFSVDNKGYLIGGSNGVFSNPSQYNDSIYVYDPLSDSWATWGDFPGTNTVYGNSISYGGKVYYGFGYAGGSQGALSDFWEFNPSSDAWTQLTSCPCAGRAEVAVVALNDTIYIGFGDNFTTTQYSDWWAYDITNDSWSQKANFPGQPRHHPQYFALNNEIYIGLGHDDNLGDLETFYRYNPSSDTWTQLNDFPVPIEGPGGQFTYQGEGYVAFGLNNTSNNNPNSGQFWKYNTSTDSWTQMPSYNGNGYLSPLTFVINNMAYMVTESNYWNGSGSTDYNKFELGLSTFITEPVTDANIHIYPNPNDGHFTINISNFENAEIIDIHGRTIKTLISNNVQTIDLNKGIYFLKIRNGKKVSIEKIVVIE